jgi:hypothetical protein
VVVGGQTEVEVANPLVHPSSKIFITFTTPVIGTWYLAHKEDGKFVVALGAPQTFDATFDYFILGTEESATSTPPVSVVVPPVLPPLTGSSTPPTASSTPPTASSTPPITSTSTPPLTTSTSTPPVADTTPPVVVLNGLAVVPLTVGDMWLDPGATATDDTDGDLTNYINVSGTVDMTTPGIYTVSYSATDAAGNMAGVSRAVSVVAAPVTATSTTATSTGP